MNKSHSVIEPNTVIITRANGEIIFVVGSGVGSSVGSPIALDFPTKCGDGYRGSPLLDRLSQQRETELSLISDL